MLEVSPGDVVFSFKNTFIKAIGIAQSRAELSIKPDFKSAGENWAKIGWNVDVEYRELEKPFRPKDHIELLRPLLPERLSPLLKNGNGLQSVYLAEISEPFAEMLIRLSESDFQYLSEELAVSLDEESEYEIKLEVEAKHLDGDLEKIQLTKSRRGQGVFKSNVRMIENHCRITGVSNIKHLRASHIKPWSRSNDVEKLSGSNGLLLSPHIDHLFDRGFISFENSGRLLISKELNLRVLDQWSISSESNVGGFKSTQEEFLHFHREHIFKS